MDTQRRPSALIAEDEPLLAMSLKAELAKLWPELHVVATVGDGLSAVKQALAMTPDVLFFDIRMPGLSGLEAAADLVDAWQVQRSDFSDLSAGADSAPRPFPLLVFVTAYDSYAVQAFEVHAVDYLVKPVQGDRLQKSVTKLQLALANRTKFAIKLDANIAGDSKPLSDPVLTHTVDQLRLLLAALPSGSLETAVVSGAGPLKLLQASVGNQIHMVPLAEVLYFEAADKYVRVMTAEREYLIRTPIKDLLPQLNPAEFWQIHRGTVVRADAIKAVSRDESGKQHLELRGCKDKLPVSRLYSHLFKAL